ncbi:hypothetical protein [Burkholderia pseudomallei]|uniref:hypothetical protein n=1 Tax=Burkholderia pseudomallei TaxID=28450 RepID=UPI001639BA34|nr:hypothetical protein [Burkholderia pseudomallei]
MAMMNRTALTVLLLMAAALLAALVIVLLTAPPPNIKTVTRAGMAHLARQE